jgi:hypothetical protein
MHSFLFTIAFMLLRTLQILFELVVLLSLFANVIESYS